MFVAVIVCLLVLEAKGCGADPGQHDANLDVKLIPKLRFYYSGLEHYTELPLEAADGILATSWYNTTRTTLLFVHGFTEQADGSGGDAVAGAFLRRGDCNVALLDWQGLAAAEAPSLADSYLNWAAPTQERYEYLGVRLAGALTRLSAAGLDLERTQLVGHSLGAHVLGLAGNALRLQGVLLPWITALDPASAAFEGKPAAGRLHAGSAAVVVAVHSDPGGYGARRAMGTADFWPNYRVGAVQPGCPKSRGQRFSPEGKSGHHFF
ncbi:lipase member H-B-like [Cydia pomonella]|uniref:lipase member H-B-like n=1 Tax=Cydia pomonella TaxID=82600 RepID=UPI002ADD86C3|nr:lipase member H-B-like [Cydia pomonella]